MLPALIRKAHQAKRAGDSSFTIWGSGSPRREFLHVDDCADALVHLLRHYSGAMHRNVGSGVEVTIRELASLIADIVGFRGRIEFDPTKPDGTPRKLLDSQLLHALGWAPKISLADGLRQTYRWVCDAR